LRPLFSWDALHYIGRQIFRKRHFVQKSLKI